MASSCWACRKKECSPHCKQAKELLLMDGNISDKVRRVTKALEEAASGGVAAKLREMYRHETKIAENPDSDLRVWYGARRTALMDFAQKTGVKL